MKTKIKKITILFSVCGLITFSSCNDWLDVDPKDKVTEDKQYSTEDNINSVMNGFYTSMADYDLYGGQLTQTTIEFLAHYYDFPPKEPSAGAIDLLPYYKLSTFDYNSTSVKYKFVPIWNKTYTTIFNINNFIKKVSASNIIDQKKKNILLGEALALRAFFHFDMFRLYGPVYEAGSNVESIPYNASAEAIAHPNETATGFLKRVLSDLEEAEKLLEDDPILTESGVSDSQDAINNTAPKDKFTTNKRNCRMNYYAVKALQARVQLQMGNNDKASAIAQEVIDKAIKIGEEKQPPFSWTSSSKNTTIDSQQNYIFYSEIIFGIDIPNLYRQWTTYFASVKPGTACVITTSNLDKNIFNSTFATTPDIRKAQWQEKKDIQGTGSNASELKYVSYKFKERSTTTLPNINKLQPLIRISELYYIQAEAALNNKDVNTAREKINIILKKRGLQDSQVIPSTAKITDIEDWLQREYYNEFYAEGQTFFYLKRRKKEKIFKGYTNGYTNISSQFSEYVVPLPLSETDI